jgi:hypothetical protein
MLIFLAGTPLALGSYWGLSSSSGRDRVRLPHPRRRKMLEEELNGYIDYTREVRVPTGATRVVTPNPDEQRAINTRSEERTKTRFKQQQPPSLALPLSY